MFTQTQEQTPTNSEYELGGGTEYQEANLIEPAPASAILEQQRVTEIIDLIEDSLLGRHWDENKQKYVKISKPLLNPTGIEGIIRFLKSYLHRGLFLSNLDEKEVSKVMILISQTITENLLLHYHDWEIDKADFNSIGDIIEHNIFFALKRAFGAGDKRYFANIQQMRTVESHSFIPQDQKQKSGGLMKMFRGGN